MADPVADPKADLATPDSSWKSRKLWLTILTQVLMFAGALLANKYNALVGLYPTLMGGLVGCLGIYFGANVSSQHITGLHAVALKKLDSDSDDSDPKV